MSRNSGFVKKGWGHEFIWATNDHYCGKFLHFNTGKKFSMHFHANKDETWYVLSGKFLVHWIDTETGERFTNELKINDTWHNKPLLPHQVECVEEGTIIEVSTADSVEDNFRVEKGD